MIVTLSLQNQSSLDPLSTALLVTHSSAGQPPHGIIAHQHTKSLPAKVLRSSFLTRPFGWKKESEIAKEDASTQSCAHHVQVHYRTDHSARQNEMFPFFAVQQIRQ